MYELPCSDLHDLRGRVVWGAATAAVHRFDERHVDWIQQRVHLCEECDLLGAIVRISLLPESNLLYIAGLPRWFH